MERKTFPQDPIDSYYRDRRPKTTDPTIPKEGPPGMNYSTVAFLCNDKTRAVKAQYEPGKQSYTYKTLDPTIKVDDIVVVPTDTRHGFTCVKVTEVDCEAPLDENDRIEYRWIVGRVDIPAYESVLEQEKQVVDAVKKGRTEKRREELSENFLAGLNGDLKALPLYQYGKEGEETG